MEGVATMVTYSRPSLREDFELAIVCALPLEFDAVSLVFDEFWDQDGDRYGRARGDQNTYTTGRVGKHNVVLALLPNMGKASAAGTTASLRSSYTKLRLVILSGICGGVPYPGDKVEIILGDVVVSKHIVQYDYGRQYPGQFVTRDTVDDTLGRPTKDIRSLLATFETEHGLENLQRKTSEFLIQLQQSAETKGRRFRYEYPGTSQDILFASTYVHKHQEQRDCSCSESSFACEVAVVASCEELRCDASNTIPRERLGEQHHLEPKKEGSVAQQPKIFLGGVGSGDTVMKSGQDRDKIANAHGLIAFEMEGAGLSNELPCIVVKGVCDYADSHKNKMWQSFAAATSASATKALLERYTQTDQPADSILRSDTSPMPSVIIPFSRDADFVERGSILDQVHRNCAKQGSRTALVGLGGVG
jgi:nucleoside phosphorylase